MKNDYNLTNGLVLDVGCGKGQRALEFAKKGNKVVAVDKDEKVVLDLSDVHENLTAVHFDIREMPIERENYDVILANNVLPFIPDKREVVVVVNKLYDGLKEGGYLEITLFGNYDEWIANRNMSFWNDEEIFDSFPILRKVYWSSEEKGYAPTMKGDIKFWHIFRFIVRK